MTTSVRAPGRARASTASAVVAAVRCAVSRPACRQLLEGLTHHGLHGTFRQGRAVEVRMGMLMGSLSRAGGAAGHGVLAGLGLA